MQLDYKQRDNKMYLISRGDMETISRSLLKEYAPTNLERPTPLNTLDFLQNYLGLVVKRRYIGGLGSGILGLIVMDDIAEIPSFDDMFRQVILEETFGTVLISPQLMNPDSLPRRRYTEVHEGCHYILHREYYNELAKQRQQGTAASCIACRKIELYKQKFHTDQDWMEWQADTLAACILMPKDVFYNFARMAIRKSGISKGYLSKGAYADKRQAYPIITEIAETFQVSYKAAQIRMIHLGLIRDLSF